MHKLSPEMESSSLQLVLVREYEEAKDREALEEMERLCEVGGQPSIQMDQLGDPLCRIRQSPPYVMLVAEYGQEKEIVGVIRGCVKTVTSGKKQDMKEFPIYVKVAYVLGLRVSPAHRRLGIGTMLVEKLEEWCMRNGAEYAYMATECSNEPSLNLFTRKNTYVKFRTPTVLVQPVHAHKKPLGSGIRIDRLLPQTAESIYNRIFADSEFFPKDINVILSNKLNLGTFIAIPQRMYSKWDPETGDLPCEFGILSVWNTKEVYTMQVKGVKGLKYACCVGSRVVDKLLPWLRIPSIPNLFNPFGVCTLYGMYMEGPDGPRLMKSLCAFVHNMARDVGGYGAIVAEVGKLDPVAEVIPHWKKFSWADDVWCMKKLRTAKQDDDKEDNGMGNWITSQSSTSIIFVDPREF